VPKIKFAQRQNRPSAAFFPSHCHTKSEVALVIKDFYTYSEINLNLYFAATLSLKMAFLDGAGLTNFTRTGAR